MRQSANSSDLLILPDTLQGLGGFHPQSSANRRACKGTPTTRPLSQAVPTPQSGPSLSTLAPCAFHGA